VHACDHHDVALYLSVATGIELDEHEDVGLPESTGLLSKFVPVKAKCDTS